MFVLAYTCIACPYTLYPTCTLYPAPYDCLFVIGGGRGGFGGRGGGGRGGGGGFSRGGRGGGRGGAGRGGRN